MLPKENRLSQRGDFSKVYKNGFYSQKENITVKFLKNNSAKLRIGFSVGKNFSKLATKRNRVRRILREGVQEILPELKTGLDMIIILQPNKKFSNILEINSVRNSLRYIFSKTNLFK
jgi:ribonuclease P protein component